MWYRNFQRSPMPFDHHSDVERVNKILGPECDNDEAKKRDALWNSKIIWNLLSHMFCCQRSSMWAIQRKWAEREKKRKEKRIHVFIYKSGTPSKVFCANAYGITITMDLMTQVLWHTLRRHTIHALIWCAHSTIHLRHYFDISTYFVQTNSQRLCHSRAILPNASAIPLRMDHRCVAARAGIIAVF